MAARLGFEHLPYRLAVERLTVANLSLRNCSVKEKLKFCVKGATQGVKLQTPSFESSTLPQLSFDFATLCKPNFSRATFKCDPGSSFFHEAVVTGGIFDHATFNLADGPSDGDQRPTSLFAGAKALTNCSFANVSLKGLDLSGIDLTGTTFNQSELDGAKLDRARCSSRSGRRRPSERAEAPRLGAPRS